MPTLTKADCIKHAAEKAGVSRELAKAIIQGWVDGMMTALKAGERVELRELFVLVPIVRKARPGRHPGTGEVIELPERRRCRVRLSPVLIKELNK